MQIHDFGKSSDWSHKGDVVWGVVMLFSENNTFLLKIAHSEEFSSLCFIINKPYYAEIFYVIFNIVLSS